MTESEVESLEKSIEEEINKPTERLISARRVCDLSKDDEDWLVEDAKNGGTHEHFDVKLFKNGNHKICLKRNKSSVAQKNIETKGQMMTNDQLLLEHVIDLEARFKAIEMKHKKLKKKYKNLKQDLYIDVDDDDDGKQQIKEDVKKESENNIESETKRRERISGAEVSFDDRLNEARREIQNKTPAYMKQTLRGWRSRISPA